VSVLVAAHGFGVSVMSLRWVRVGGSRSWFSACERLRVPELRQRHCQRWRCRTVGDEAPIC
jgi:hypothetical protein